MVVVMMTSRYCGGCGWTVDRVLLLLSDANRRPGSAVSLVAYSKESEPELGVVAVVKVVEAVAADDERSARNESAVS